MHTLVIVAGTSEPSNSNALADAFIEGMKKVPGMTVEKKRLKDLHIEHFTLNHYDPSYCQNNDDFCSLVPLIKDASGIVIASPIWNFSVPAHLKNFIDRMGAVALDKETHSKGQFNGRPFYLIYTGGAPMIAWKALMYLTTLHITEAVKYYGGVVVSKWFEPKSLPGRGKFGLVVDKRPATLESLRKKGEWFGKTVDHYAKTGKLPFIVTFRYKFFSFAYRVGNRIMYPISKMQ